MVSPGQCCTESPLAREASTVTSRGRREHAQDPRRRNIGCVIAVTCLPAFAGTEHRSTVSLHITQRGYAIGMVRSATPRCHDPRNVLLFLRVGGGWHPVGRDTTRASGTNRVELVEPVREYRALIRKLIITHGHCSNDVSRVVPTPMSKLVATPHPRIGPSATAGHDITTFAQRARDHPRARAA